MKKGLASSFRGDLIIAGSVLVAVWGAGVYLDLYGYVQAFLRQHEQWQLDEAVFFFLILSIVACWLAYRRWREAEHVNAQAKQSEMFILDVAKNSSDVLWVGNLDLSEMYFVSPAYETLWGQPPEALYASPDAWLDAVHPDDRERMSRSLGNMADAREYEEEYRIVQPDGSICWILESTFPVLDEKGEPFRLAGVAKDITEKKCSEIAACESQQRLQSILDNTSSLIYLKDLEGKYILVNKQWEKMFDVTQEWIVGKTDHDVFPEATAHAFQENDRQVIKENKAREMEESAPHNDGLHTYLSVKFPLTDVSGNIYGMGGISTDISEMKEAQENLKFDRAMLDSISHAQSRFIADASPQAVFDSLLNELLAITGSEYGFIGRILYTEDDVPYLKTFALSNIAWNEETLEFYEQNAPSGMEFRNLDSLFGEVIKTGQYVFANDPASDPRACGRPEGHPPLNAFMGIPFVIGGELIGMAGMANRPEGYDERLRDMLKPLTASCGQIISAYNLNEQRKETENLLIQTQERYEEAQHVAHLGHWELDLIENNLIWSKENCHIFGSTTKAANNYETFLERVHPDDRDDVNHAYTSSVENSTAYDIEHRLLMPDGSVKWVQEQCHTDYNKDGTAVRSIGTTQDITKRKLADIQMLESRERFSGIVEMAADAIISINEEQKVVLFNKAAEGMFAVAASEIMGEHVDRLIPTRFHKSHHKKVEDFLNEEVAPLMHRRVGMFGRRFNGEEFPVEISISKQVIGDKPIMTVMMRDLSDQVSAQAEQRKLLKAIGEAGEAVIITDRNATIEYVNPAFTGITGYDAEEAIGNTPAMLKSDAQNPSFYRELWQTILAGDVWHGTLIDRRKDGSFYPALMSIAPIHDDAGEITHFVSLQQDMTEYKRLEDQFLQAQKMEAIGTLVGGIAYDFNNMLAALQGNVYLAKSRVNDPVIVAEKLMNIERLSSRAADIVRQLLTFSRKDRVEMRGISFNSFVKEGLKLAESGIPENIKFIKDVIDQRIMVKGDATQLQQLLMNLLNNARDAVADTEKPIIKTSVSLFEPTNAFRHKYPEVGAGPMVCLSVQDNGSGIEADLIEKVLEPFFTTKGVGKGTGLGLAMVYGAVQRHGGLIEIDSQIGHGTTVQVYLPLLSEQCEEVQQSVVGHGETILLVDDEQLILETIGEVLISLGYVVVEAVNGEKAFEHYRYHRDEIDMVISDVVMPVMGGIELAHMIRESDSQMPIILVTGYDFSGRSEEIKQIDHCGLINKPANIAELSLLIEAMLIPSR